MKKSVILIITTMSLIAIILIGLIFQRAEVYNVVFYVQEVICTDIKIGDVLYPTYFDNEQEIYRINNPNKPNTPLTLYYVPNLTVDIICTVTPSNATIWNNIGVDSKDGVVSFYGDPNSVIARVNQSTGRLIFIDEGTVTITIKANDNQNRTARIRIRAIDPNA